MTRNQRWRDLKGEAFWIAAGSVAMIVGGLVVGSLALAHVIGLGTWLGVLFIAGAVGSIFVLRNFVNLENVNELVKPSRHERSKGREDRPA